jgi:hypothetical protein
MHGAGMEASVKSEITAKLNSFIKPIAYRLEQEILRRYYFDDALYESSFTGDPDLEAALKILHDSVQYQRILKP